MKIEIKVYDRRTELLIDKNLPVGLIQIKQVLADAYMRGSVSYIEEIDGINIFKIDCRLLVKQKARVNKKLHEIAGIDIIKPKKTTSSKEPTNVDESVIVGFKGNLVHDYFFLFKQV
jgi:hypothetical protein